MKSVFAFCVIGTVYATSASAENALRSSMSENLQKLMDAKEARSEGRNLGIWPFSSGSDVPACPACTCNPAACNCPTPTASKDIDICAVYGDDKCGADGTCVNTPTGFKCDCDEGHSGKSCELKDLCEIDEPCKHAKSCTNVNIDVDGNVLEDDDADETDDDDFYCHCETGWTGKTCSVDTDGYYDESPKDADDDEISFVCPPLRVDSYPDGVHRNQMEESNGKCVDINWCDEERTDHLECDAGQTCVDEVHTSEEILLYEKSPSYVVPDMCKDNTLCLGRRCASGYTCEDGDGDLSTDEDATAAQKARGWYCKKD